MRLLFCWAWWGCLSTIWSLSQVPILPDLLSTEEHPYSLGHCKSKYWCLQNKNNPRVFASALNEQKRLPQEQNLEMNNKISVRRLLSGVDREKSGLFSLRPKINFENTHPVEGEGFFSVALVAEMPRKGWIFWHVGQTVANRSSKLVTLSTYKLEVIHAGFYFNSKATKPAEIHLRWVPWNERISSGQQSWEWVPRACGGTRSRGWSCQCQARRKEQATAAALAGREQKQAPNPAALCTFITFVCEFSEVSTGLKNWKKKPGGPFLLHIPKPNCFYDLAGQKRGYFSRKWLF